MKRPSSSTITGFLHLSYASNAFCDSSNEPILFESKVVGTISKNIQGEGWGYDPIFIPENQNKTYAELADKNKISHRYESLKKFANWFKNKQE